MADYIVCQKKRNTPRLNVQICEQRCPLKSDCKEYLTYLRGRPNRREITAHLSNSSLAPAVS